MTIDVPVDDTKSRLRKPTESPENDSFVLATDRIRAFHNLYPDGRIITTVERDVYGDAVVFTVAAHVYKTSESDKPDAMAHATRDTRDEDDGVARRPQETAETVAVSRALRNVGILVSAEDLPRVATKRLEWLAEDDVQIGENLRNVRISHGMNQSALCDLMREQGFRWSPPVLSRIESGERSLSILEVRHLNELIGFLP